jgi:hypothetical protein
MLRPLGSGMCSNDQIIRFDGMLVVGSLPPRRAARGACRPRRGGYSLSVARMMTDVLGPSVCTQ